MKKIYFAPETDVIILQSQPLLNIVSNGDGTMDGGGNQGDLTDDDEVLSRRKSNSVWDDEDFEEEDF